MKLIKKKCYPYTSMDQTLSKNENNKKKEMQEELEKNMNFMGILNIPLSKLKNQIDKKINKGIEELNNTSNTFNLWTYAEPLK